MRRYNPDGVFNEPLSSFFYNCDPKTGVDIPIGSGCGKIRGLKARSVLIDSEEGVLGHVLRSKLGELFSGGHFIKDSSGAGNNWAVSGWCLGEVTPGVITVNPLCCDCRLGTMITGRSTTRLCWTSSTRRLSAVIRCRFTRGLGL